MGHKMRSEVFDGNSFSKRFEMFEYVALSTLVFDIVCTNPLALFKDKIIQAG